MASQREKAEALIEARDDIVRGVAVAIGMMFGGPSGARLGNAAGQAFNLSPFNTALLEAADAAVLSAFPQSSASTPSPKPKKRRRSAYSRRYSQCFKKLAPKYKKKNGSWKKDGFKRCAAAARRCAKR